MMMNPTDNSLFENSWDAIVIGAGPAGTVSAMQIAGLGFRVLLVEAKKFPRDKVCGGCLNRRAWNVLETTGLARTLVSAGAVPLDRLHLVCGGHAAEWSMPRMHSISRRTMDELFVHAASERGVQVLMETQARVLATVKESDQYASVQLRVRGEEPRIAKAKVIIAADGLTHPSLSDMHKISSRVEDDSHIGLGATLTILPDNHSDAARYGHDQLTMIAGQHGYVGIARVEQNQLNLAAAIAPSRLRAAGSPAAAIVQLFRENGLVEPSGCQDAAWLGTPALTRESSNWAGHRLFLVGDAAGYVEPFTGEGMSWALSGAVEVAEFARRAIEGWTPDLASQWHRHWRHTVRANQWPCRSLAWLLRKPRLASWSLRTIRYTPWLARNIMQRVAG